MARKGSNKEDPEIIARQLEIAIKNLETGEQKNFRRDNLPGFLRDR